MRDLKTIEEEIIILKNNLKEFEEKTKYYKQYGSTEEEQRVLRLDIGAANELLKELYEEREKLLNSDEISIKELHDKIKEMMDETIKKNKKIKEYININGKQHKDSIYKDQYNFKETPKYEGNKTILIHSSLVEEYDELAKLKSELLKKYNKEEKQNNNELKEEIDKILTKEKNNEEIVSYNDGYYRVDSNDKDKLISMLDELNENNNKDVEEIKEEENEKENIERQINEILNEKTGKKMFVKYKQKQYYIPKKERGKFLTLMSTLNRINNDLNINEDEVKQNNEETVYNINFENQISSNEAVKNDNVSSEKPKEENVTNDIMGIIFKNEKTKEDNEKILPMVIKKIRKPKLSKKVKRWILNSAAVIASAITILGISNIKHNNTVHAVDNKASITQDDNLNITPDNIEDINETVNAAVKDYHYQFDQMIKDYNEYNYKNNEVESKDITKDVEKEEVKEETVKEEKVKKEEVKEETTNEKNEYSIRIGNNVNINDNEKIYRNTMDASLEENALTPYFDAKDDRIVIGLSIEYEGKNHNIFACTENANKTIDNLINNGGTIVSVLTANKNNLENADNMTLDDVVNNAEGWYNIRSVSQMKGNGYSR